MSLQALARQIELVRKKMEDTAGQLGINHPKVYELSRELDRLHNLWERQRRQAREVRPTKRRLRISRLRTARRRFCLPRLQAA